METNGDKMKNKFIEAVKANVRKIMLEKVKQRRNNTDILLFCEDTSTPGIDTYIEDVMDEIVQIIEIHSEDFEEAINCFFDNAEEIREAQRDFNSED